MSRTLFALPILGLSACATPGDLTSTDASRLLSPADQVICTEAVVTSEADGSVASSIQCERVND